jgi:hypothetical protein
MANGTVSECVLEFLAAFDFMFGKNAKAHNFHKALLAKNGIAIGLRASEHPVHPQKPSLIIPIGTRVFKLETIKVQISVS